MSSYTMECGLLSQNVFEANGTFQTSVYPRHKITNVISDYTYNLNTELQNVERLSTSVTKYLRAQTVFLINSLSQKMKPN